MSGKVPPAGELPRSRLDVGKPYINFGHRRRFRGEPSEELIWVQVRLASGWVHAYRLAPQGGGHVIAEIRIYPYEEEAEHGEWSGAPGSVPTGGISWDVQRELRIQDVRRHAQEFIEHQVDERGASEYLARVLPRFGLSISAFTEDGVRRRRRRPDYDVARAAAAYVGADTSRVTRIAAAAQELWSAPSPTPTK